MITTSATGQRLWVRTPGPPLATAAGRNAKLCQRKQGSLVPLNVTCPSSFLFHHIPPTVTDHFSGPGKAINRSLCVCVSEH